MPGFRYDDYVNPYAGSISDLLQRSGQIESQRALAVAAAQSRAADTRGLAWASVINNIGNNVADTIRQAPVMRAADQRAELTALEVDQAKREAKSKLTLETALKDPRNYTADPAGHYALDEAKVGTYLQAQDVGAWQTWNALSAATRKEADAALKAKIDLQSSMLTLDEKQRAAQDLRRAAVGTIAYAALGTLREKPEDVAHARDVAIAAAGLAAGRGDITEAEANQFIAQTRGAAPAQLAEILKAAIDPAQFEKFEKAKADRAKVEADTAALTAKNAPVDLAQFTAQLDQMSPSAEQRKTALARVQTARGRDEANAILKEVGDDAERARAATTAAGRTAQMMASGTEASPFRPDAATGNRPDRRTGLTPNSIYNDGIMYALTGRVPAGSRSMATIPGQNAVRNTGNAILAEAGVNPGDLQAEYAGAKASTRQLMTRYQFTAASAQAARDNLELAASLAKDVPRTGAPVVNRYQQALTAWAGGKELPGLTAYEVAIYTAVREYAKVTSGSAASVAGLTDSAQAEAGRLLNAAQTPAQFKAASDVMIRDMDNFIAPMKAEIGKATDVGPALKRFIEFVGGGQAISTTSGGATPITVGGITLTPGAKGEWTSPSGAVYTQQPDGTYKRIR